VTTRRDRRIRRRARGGRDQPRAREVDPQERRHESVLNDVSDPAIGFESTENAVTLIDREGEIEVRSLEGVDPSESILVESDEIREPYKRAHCLSGLY